MPRVHHEDNFEISGARKPDLDCMSVPFLVRHIEIRISRGQDQY